MRSHPAGLSAAAHARHRDWRHPSHTVIKSLTAPGEPQDNLDKPGEYAYSPWISGCSGIGWPGVCSAWLWSGLLVVWDDWGMAKGYRPVNRDQLMLLPADMREWLPAGHAVHVVIEAVVHHLDTSAFHAGRKTGGPGAAGYDPD